MNKPIFQVQFTEIALDNLKRYPMPDQRRILENIEKLAQDPFAKSNVKRLVNFDVAYRLRVGRYRILFDLQEALQIIDIIDILPRGRAYSRK